MRLYLTALILGFSLLLSKAATVTGNLADSFGNAYAATYVQYTPVKVFQDNGSATVIPSTVTQSVTNGVLNPTNFTSVAALYSIKILPQNLNIPVVYGLVPNSTNSYTFSQILALATNLTSYVQTNGLVVGYLAGNNITFTTNGSLVTINATGGSSGISTNLNVLDWLVNGTNTPAWREGREFYDSASHSLSYYTDRTNVTVNSGQEVLKRVKNMTGATITNGVAVTLTTSSGNPPRIVLAQATTDTTSSGFDCIGLATEDIAHGSEGFVCVLGTVHGINTDSWIEGSAVYVSTNAGVLTTNPPPSNYARILVGAVDRGNGNNGDIFVMPQQAIHVADVTGLNIVTNGGGVLAGMLTNATFSQLGSNTISGIVSGMGVITNNYNNASLGGTFSGDGSGLTNLPSQSLKYSDGSVVFEQSEFGEWSMFYPPDKNFPGTNQSYFIDPNGLRYPAAGSLGYLADETGNIDVCFTGVPFLTGYGIVNWPFDVGGPARVFMNTNGALFAMNKAMFLDTNNVHYGNGSGLTNIQGSGIAGLPPTNQIATTNWVISQGYIPSVGSGATLIVSNNAQTIISFESNTNNWSEVRIKNRNAGAKAQSTLTLESDNGTTNSFYTSLNINSSGYSNGAAIWPWGTNWASWTTFGNATNYAIASATASAAIGVAQTNSVLAISVGNGLTRTNVLISDSGIALNSGTYSGNGAGLTNLNTGGFFVRLSTNIVSTNNFTQTWGLTLTNNGVYSATLRCSINGAQSADRPNLFIGCTNTDARGFLEYSFVSASSTPLGGYSSVEANNYGSIPGSVVLKQAASGGGDLLDGTRSVVFARSVGGTAQYLTANADLILNVTNAPVTLWTVGRTGTTGTNTLYAGAFWRVMQIQ